MRQAAARSIPIGGILAGIAMSASIVWFAVVVMNGARIREERTAALLMEIATENSETCARLGLGPERGAAIFRTCARELDAVRRHEDARLESPLL